MIPPSHQSATRAHRFLWQSLRLPVLGAAMLGATLLGNVAARAVSTTVVISEVRTRGPLGGNDEFIELYNLSSAPVNISGYKINGSNGNAAPAVSTRLTIADGTTLQPGQHFLAVNNSTSGGYSGTVSGDTTYGLGITDNGGVALLTPTDVIVDAVGFSTNSAYKEGTPLTPLAGTANQSYERKPGGAAGNKTDTDDNTADFTLVTSNPQNLSSAVTPAGTANTAPVLNNQTFNATTQGNFSVALNATDADGDTLTYSVTAGTSLPAGLSLNTATGVISGTPAATGVFRFSINVSDGTATTTAKYALVVSDRADGVGPLITYDALPASGTRADYASRSLSGTVQDVASGTTPPSGVSRVLVQLRTGDNTQAYNGSAFSPNLGVGYYVATLGAGGVSDVRSYDSSLSFFPGNIAPGDYLLLLYPQDNAGNYTAQFIKFTIVASSAAAAAKAQPPGGSSNVS